MTGSFTFFVSSLLPLVDLAIAASRSECTQLDQLQQLALRCCLGVQLRIIP